MLTVRRRWNDPRSAAVELAALRDLSVRNDPGGVCGALPRPFIFGHAWCDHVVGGDALHACDAATAPHELELCVLDRDNPPESYRQLRALMRRPA